MAYAFQRFNFENRLQFETGIETPLMPTVRPLTHAPGHHFFGYYGIDPWLAGANEHLALQTDFHDRRPTEADEARVGLVDRASGVFTELDRTRAFNLQQGAMLHVIDVGFGEEIVFNVWRDGRLGVRAVNPKSGLKRELHGSLAAVARHGAVALGLDRARSYHIRSVTGYACGAEHFRGACPADDGIFRLDLKTGSSTLVLPLSELLAAAPPPPGDYGAAWIDHLHLNPSGTRALLIGRIKLADSWLSSLWSVSPDGAGLKALIPFGRKVSHFDWFDDETILVSSNLLGPMQFILLNERTGAARALDPEVLPADGHASYRADRRWLLCDTYPRGTPPRAQLFVYELASRRRVDVGPFDSPEPFRGDIRCDLHPRWSADGQSFTFDSIHEGSRQIYLAKVGDVAE